MFKKPLGNIKTSAPLRGSDRRKFKQRVVASFGVSSDEGDQLVPDGLQSVKFSTHLNELGVAYLAPDGDPLWLTIGKGSDDLIPTIYTLWRKPNLLPILCTPPAVIPVLVGGADLMIPGGRRPNIFYPGTSTNASTKTVVHPPPTPIAQGQLVSVCQLDLAQEKPTLSAPMAVGRMAIPSDQMKRDARGKAVLVTHTWKDFLWEMGHKGEPPEPTIVGEGIDGQNEEEDTKEEEQPPETPPTTTTASVSYTAQEVTDLLHSSLLQAISTILSSLPPASFPIPASILYTNYILPCRPADPVSILSPSALSTLSSPSSMPSSSDITIKASTHKSLTTFLKAAEKASILTLKAPQKHSQQTDLFVMSVNKTNQSVLGHIRYESVKDAEEKAEKKARRADKEKEGQVELSVRLLWKPHLESVRLFEGLGGDPKKLYTLPEIKTLLNGYISSQNLFNPNDRSYVNLDELLSECIHAKGHKKGDEVEEDEAEGLLGSEFMKREKVVQKVIAKMQDWYEIVRDGEVVQKKGALKPVQIVVKSRNNKKAATYITGFEPFISSSAEMMADELRKVCASATSVQSLPGKNAGMEVMVQGKQAKAAIEYLTSSGVPKQWVEVVEKS